MQIWQGGASSLLLRRANGLRSCQRLVHFRRSKNRPHSQVHIAGSICGGRYGCHGNLVGTINEAIIGTLGIVEVPNLKPASDRRVKLSNILPKSRGSTLLQILHSFGRVHRPKEVSVIGSSIRVCLGKPRVVWVALIRVCLGEPAVVRIAGVVLGEPRAMRVALIRIGLGEAAVMRVAGVVLGEPRAMRVALIRIGLGEAAVVRIA